MDAYDPISKSYSYSYTSVDSPDINYDVPYQQNSDFFDNFFIFDEWMNKDQASIVPEYQDHSKVYASAGIDDGSRFIGSSRNSSHLQGDSSSKQSCTAVGQAQKGMKEKVAFKTKSQVEILDDGFKWRKYGKKMVKTSPNPRNYYRCSAEGCSVKKRVERDVEDARYVITTYEGVHNHQRPSNF